MDSFIQINRKRVEDSGKSTKKIAKKRKKYRKYDDQYLDFEFTYASEENVELPQCVVCHKVLVAESMLPNKLIRHLETTHKLLSPPKHCSLLTRSLTVLPNAKNSHTIAEDLILPAAIDMVSVMIGESAAEEIKNIPLSNNTISRRIPDIAEDINEQILKKLSGLFAILRDEASDSNNDVN
ncbi:zinc finger BED domain-containing protein 5-like [Centruroides vittatus]|uniref:zinc finger BED domain-containing protein 5-like n=1 Tax=Centruroides vittatus TaxID=120091 RepID=UPI00351032D8